MGAQIRVYRQKIASTTSMRKIFKAMELIATSRIGKARARVEAALPYSNAITRAVSAVATQSADVEHPLLVEKAQPQRAAVVIMAADRGMAGAYSTSVLKRAEELIALLNEQGKEVDLYVYGRKAVAYLDFRDRAYVKSWTGNTDNPSFETAREIAAAVVDAFLKEDTEENSVDEIHLVYTQFKSMVNQVPHVVRLLPLEVVEEEVEAEEDLLPLYDFEPSPEEVLEALLPKYIESRIFAAELQAAASELAARQRAMKSAGDNASDLIKKYTLLRNNARQAEITQELTELIAGADALNAS